MKSIPEIRQILARTGIIVPRQTLYDISNFKKRGKTIHQTGKTRHLFSDDEALQIVEAFKKREELYATHETISGAIELGRKNDIEVNRDIVEYWIKQGVVQNVAIDPVSELTGAKKYFIPKPQVTGILYRSMHIDAPKRGKRQVGAPFFTPEEAAQEVRKSGGKMDKDTILLMIRKNLVNGLAQYWAKGMANWLIPLSEVERLKAHSQSGIRTFMRETHSMTPQTAIRLGKDISQARRVKGVYSFPDAARVIGISIARLRAIRPPTIKIAGQNFISRNEVVRIRTNREKAKLKSNTKKRAKMASRRIKAMRRRPK